MIITKLRGGLGNQLFQYALGRHLALRHQTELRFDTSYLDKSHQWTYRSFALEAFHIQATAANKTEIKSLKGTFSPWLSKINLPRHLHTHYYREPHFHFAPSVLSIPDKAYLDGYWQSEKYFAPIASTIREDLAMQFPPSGAYQNWSKKIKSTLAVSVHIRRGDYLHYSKSNLYLCTCPQDYYHRALDLLTSQISSSFTLFVFSDDIEWCKANLSFSHPTHFVEPHSAPEDLWLMASCQHHIIANSTFSWWGAWLNPNPNKIVIAPLEWFHSGRFDTKDLLPESWLRI